MSGMSKRSARDFAQAEICAMQASLDNLLQRYVRPGSDMAIALTNANLELDGAAAAVDKAAQYRRKPVGRFAGGAK